MDFAWPYSLQMEIWEQLDVSANINTLQNFTDKSD